MSEAKKSRWMTGLFLVFFLVCFYAKITGQGFFFGYRMSLVLSESMEPNIPVYSLLIEKKTNEVEVFQVGEIITFSRKNAEGKTYHVTHRIVEIEEGIRTKGDNNQKADSWILAPKEIESKVLFIFPYFLPMVGIFLGCLFFFFFFRKQTKSRSTNNVALKAE